MKEKRERKGYLGEKMRLRNWLTRVHGAKHATVATFRKKEEGQVRGHHPLKGKPRAGSQRKGGKNGREANGTRPNREKTV